MCVNVEYGIHLSVVGVYIYIYPYLPSFTSLKGPSTHYVRTLEPVWVPKAIKKDYLDP